MEALAHLDLDSSDLAAMPLDVEEPVFRAIRDRLERGDIHNWLDLYFVGADTMRYTQPDLPLSTIHRSVTLIVAKVIEDAI